MRKNTPFLIKFTFFFLSIILAIPMHSQYMNAGADEVISFIPGTGQNSGQSSEYFPKNVLGLPDISARYEIPATSPESICSLGLGGEITLSFREKILVDGPGIDFSIFENAFYSPDFKKFFIEPAEVSVSRDGVTFFSFPYDSYTLQGCAGITPINGDNDPFNPTVSGGNGFDLAEIGVDTIRYIRIKDISGLLQNRKHPLYDAVITGFDLDAVVGLHLLPMPTTPISVTFSQKAANISCNKDFEIYCYTISGKLLSKQELLSNSSIYSLEDLPVGIFALVIKTTDNSTCSTYPFILCP